MNDDDEEEGEGTEMQSIPPGNFSILFYRKF
jgi:hypothetical protein